MDIDNTNKDINVKSITISAKINIIIPKIVGAVDKCKISDRDAVYISKSLSEALRYVVNYLIIYKSSIRRCRMSASNT